MAFTRTSFTYGDDYSFDPAYLEGEIGIPRGDLDALALTPEEVGRLSWPERMYRVDQLLEVSELLFHQAGHIARTHGGKREIAAVAGMLSGGNDSTTAVYAMRRYLTHLIHADTGVCLSMTREFSQHVADDLGIPLLIPKAPRAEDSYEHLVTRPGAQGGFPGPARHDLFMNRIKERAWREGRRQLVTDGRKQRIIQVAGRRRSESQRRANVPEMQREDSVVWVSPLVLWTKLDLNAYRRMYRLRIPGQPSGDGTPREVEVPRNQVYEWLHYSGECLCGSKARIGEREWLFGSFPDDPAVAKLQRLETELAGRDDIPPERRVWGCGGTWKGCTSGMCND
jgi:3'-phosphoadenosine 5'-phosphosulfate sulfotransferase (PAPS reductase)/FAD synthetase